MEEWKEYKLGDFLLIPIRNGLTKPSAIRGQGVKMIGMKEIFAMDYIRSVEMDRVPVTNKEYESSEIMKYDLLFARQSLTLEGAGKCSIVVSVDEPTVFESHLIRLRIDTKKANPFFIYYYYKSSIGKNQIKSLVQQVAAAGIRGKELIELGIKVPHIEKQNQIASILKSLDDKIEVNRKINENLEQEAQALFKSWFVDFEPFKNGEFVESELGMIPKGWRVGSIYDYIDVVYGAPYKSSLFNDKKEGLPLIRIRDLKTNAPQFYTPEILPNTEFVKAGDIVAGMDAEFIPYVWLGEKGVLNQRCCKFRGKNEAISNYYILFLIKPELEYVQSYKTGTTVSHLGKSDIDRFRFVTPPLDVVKSFSDLVDGMLKELVNRANESRRLAELRDTLLPKLMSGELKVNDIH